MLIEGDQVPVATPITNCSIAGDVLYSLLPLEYALNVNWLIGIKVVMFGTFASSTI